MLEEVVGMANNNQTNLITVVTISPLEELQRRFAIIDLGGEIRVVNQYQIKSLLDGSFIGEPSFYRKTDAQVLMMRELEQLPVNCKPGQVISDFWTSPRTKFYNATAFTPTQTPATTLNFWVGPIPSAAPGRWVEIRDFLRDIICAGNEKTYDYLIRFLAHMIQKPHEKPGVIITLLGGQGTGKGVFFSLLRAIWLRTFLLVSDIEQVIGRFNACLERNFVICMDEALFSGDRKAMDRLKSMITEYVIQIEQKFQPARSIQSVHRLFASSNHSHFGNIEMDDRRFVFLSVSNSKQQDTYYFGQIAAFIEDEKTVGALIYYLQRKDLTTFNVRAKPNTNEHLEQKLKSLQGVARYWFEALAAGSLCRTQQFDFLSDENWWSVPVFVPSAILSQRYIEFNKNAERHHTVQIAEVSKTIRELCPSAKVSRQMWKPRQLSEMRQTRGLLLPCLDDARLDFERVIGGKIDWD
jgi:hypothetical protein